MLYFCALRLCVKAYYERSGIEIEISAIKKRREKLNEARK